MRSQSSLDAIRTFACCDSHAALRMLRFACCCTHAAVSMLLYRRDLEAADGAAAARGVGGLRGQRGERGVLERADEAELFQGRGLRVWAELRGRRHRW
eukprot:1399781-Rhodomonas_salina.1